MASATSAGTPESAKSAAPSAVRPMFPQAVGEKTLPQQALLYYLCGDRSPVAFESGVSRDGSFNPDHTPQALHVRTSVPGCHGHDARRKRGPEQADMRRSSAPLLVATRTAEEFRIEIGGRHRQLGDTGV